MTGAHDRRRVHRQADVVASTFAYVVAFNAVFFAQALFLVLPKAFTPGLSPTLFHNDHDWTGNHPFEDLLQGSGVVATIVVGFLALGWIRRHRRCRALSDCSWPGSLCRASSRRCNRSYLRHSCR